MQLKYTTSQGAQQKLDCPTTRSSLEPWRTAIAKAQAAVALLNNDQKASLCTGTGWMKAAGVGNIDAIPEIGFSGLVLQDGPTGIRFCDKTTVFPAQINAAAMWDRDLMRKRGAALGKECFRKGINVLLAPGMNLQRVPAGGRNWEYSGADPYLTGEVAFETIQGIQSQGVQACAKHFLNNEQEHFRTSSSSNVDDRTQHTLYYHPFLRSVQAGVANFMSSYNRVNGTYTSEHHHLLADILKTQMDFKGPVMSDWWAAQSGLESALAGLDMMMPGETHHNGEDTFFGKHLVDFVRDGKLPQPRLDDMATRILAAWYLLKQDSSTFPKCNFNSWDLTDPKTNSHVEAGPHDDLCRELGAASIVLLRNEDNVLPLNTKTLQRLAVIGQCAGDSDKGPQNSGSGGADAANEPTSGILAVGWGSATSNFPYLISPLQAIQSIRQNHQAAFALDWHLDNSDIEGAADRAAKSEVAIVFVHSSSGEAHITVDGNEGDRNNLDLWANGAELVKAVADKSKTTIVVVHAVGPVNLEPFVEHPNVKAILHAGLLGQEAGHAVADILFGFTSPSGRLPFTIAKDVKDYGSEVLYESADKMPDIDYTERHYIDYRYLDKNQIEPRYPFGFGLSYSSFKYAFKHADAGLTLIESKLARPKDSQGLLVSDWLHETIATVSFYVTNTGKVPSKAIVQLYIGSPDEADEAPRVLRGFEAVPLKVGETKRVIFRLSRYALSYWQDEWIMSSKTYRYFIGEHSRDQKLQGMFAPR